MSTQENVNVNTVTVTVLRTSQTKNTPPPFEMPAPTSVSTTPQAQQSSESPQSPAAQATWWEWMWGNSKSKSKSTASTTTAASAATAAQQAKKDPAAAARERALKKAFVMWVDSYVDFCVTGHIWRREAAVHAPYDSTWRYPAAERVVTVGDIHGDFAKARKTFLAAGLIDYNDNWIGGNTVCVQVRV